MLERCCENQFCLVDGDNAGGSSDSLDRESSAEGVPEKPCSGSVCENPAGENLAVETNWWSKSYVGKFFGTCSRRAKETARIATTDENRQEEDYWACFRVSSFYRRNLVWCLVILATVLGAGISIRCRGTGVDFAVQGSGLCDMGSAVSSIVQNLGETQPFLMEPKYLDGASQGKGLQGRPKTKPGAHEVLVCAVTPNMQRWCETGKMMLDTGAPICLASESWLAVVSRGVRGIIRRKSSEKFLFGAGDPVKASYSVLLPIRFGSVTHTLKVHILPDKVKEKSYFLPLLLGLDDIKRVGLDIMGGEGVRLRSTGEYLPFEIDEKHLISSVLLGEPGNMVRDLGKTFNCTVIADMVENTLVGFGKDNSRSRVVQHREKGFHETLCNAAGIISLAKDITLVNRTTYPSSRIKITGNPEELLVLCMNKTECSRKVVTMGVGEISACDLDPVGKYEIFVIFKLPEALGAFSAEKGVAKNVCQVTISGETLETVRNLHAGCKINGCRICGIEKRRRNIMQKIPSTYKPTKSGESVVADIVGPVAKSFSGKQYAIVLLDIYDGRVLAWPIRTRAEGARGYAAWINIHGKIDVLQTDGAREFGGGEFKKALERNGTRHKVTTPYEHWQNGAAEAAIRVLTRRTRIALAESGLPHAFWSAAILWSSLHRNFELRRENNRAPYHHHLSDETFDSIKSRFRCFGCRCYYVEAAEKTSKIPWFAPRRRAGILLGNDPTANWSYLVQDAETGKTARTVQLLADESVMTTFRNYSILNSFTEIDGQLTEKMKKLGLGDDRNDSAGFTPTEHEEMAPILPQETSEISLETLIVDDASGWETMVTEEDSNAENSGTSTETPKSRHEVKHCEAPAKHRSFFGQAKTDELDSWEDHGVLDKEEKYTGDGQILTARWVLTWKPCSPVETDWEGLRSKSKDLSDLSQGEWRRLKKTISNNVRPKARLCVRGFLERILGMVSSPTGDIASLRLVLSLLSGCKVLIRSFGVKTAFLKDDKLKRSVWIRTPIELQQRGYPKICKLKRPAYGLSDAPLAWFVRLANHLESSGWVGSSVDSCVFIKPGGVIFLYVDDGLYGIAEEGQGDLLDDLFKEFGVQARSIECKGFKFCGVWAKQNDDYTIDLSQEKYIETVTKLEFSYPDSHQLSSEETLLVQGLAGELAWVGLRTRPESLVNVAEITAEPNTGKAAKTANSVADYLQSTKHYKLLLHPINPAEVRQLSFSDANHGRKRNRGGQFHALVNRKSLAAAYESEQFMKLNLVFCKPARLHRVSISTFHSELLAIQAAADYLISLRQLLQEILSIWGFSPAPPPCLLTDAKNIVSCTRATQPHATERRLLLYIMQMQEVIREGDLVLEFISNAYQMADLLTKPLPRTASIIRSLYEHSLKLKITRVWGPTYTVDRVVAFCARWLGFD